MKQTVIAAALLAISPLVHADPATLPTDEQIQGIKNLCAGGNVQEVSIKVDAALSKWKTLSAGLDAAAAKKNLGAVMEKVNTEAGGVALYTQYISCVQNLVARYVK